MWNVGTRLETPCQDQTGVSVGARRARRAEDVIAGRMSARYHPLLTNSTPTHHEILLITAKPSHHITSRYHPLSRYNHHNERHLCTRRCPLGGAAPVMSLTTIHRGEVDYYQREV